MANNKYMIWSSEINVKDWKDYIAEELIPRFYEEEIDQIKMDFKELPLADGVECDDCYLSIEDLDLSKIDIDQFINKHYDYVYGNIADLNDEYLHDERVNLDIPTNNRIIIIADLGLWDGRHAGFSYTDENNINSCLTSHIDYGYCQSEFYVEKVGRTLELKSCDRHHDGRNYYTYRELKDGLSATQIDNFENKLASGIATRADINKYTRSLGEEIQEVYGFEFGKESRNAER